MSATALRVAILGGGIGGVAAANALLRCGIDVRVYEQASALTEVGAGVALQPNGLRMLRRLGFGDEIARWGARWVDPQYRRADGTVIAPMWPPAPSTMPAPRSSVNSVNRSITVSGEPTMM